MECDKLSPRVMPPAPYARHCIDSRVLTHLGPECKDRCYPSSQQTPAEEKWITFSASRHCPRVLSTEGSAHPFTEVLALSFHSKHQSGPSAGHTRHPVLKACNTSYDTAPCQSLPRSHALLHVPMVLITHLFYNCHDSTCGLWLSTYSEYLQGQAI